jgi:TPR repeat protein
MARFEMRETDLAGIGMQNVSGDVFFQLGINYSTGRGVSADMIAAHKWFNLAAARGNAEAIQYRKELSSEMSAAQIAEAQRQAREWISLH